MQLERRAATFLARPRREFKVCIGQEGPVNPASSATAISGFTTNQQRTMLAILEAIHSPTNLHSLMANITRLVRDATACEAVGIRLRDGFDYPYFETSGFPEEFVRLETSLCPKAVDPGAEPLLECMCGNVLQGRVDANQPFFSARGSFCSNATTQLLANTTEVDRQSTTRNRCNGWGFETVVLVPLRHAGNTFGLLQVNDSRTDRMPKELLEYLEQLASAVALGLAHQQSVEALARKNGENELMLQELQHRVRNSLQLVVSLLRLQERDLGAEADAHSALGSALRRVESMAWVHDQLATEGQFGVVELTRYLWQLVGRLQRAFAGPSHSIHVDSEPTSIMIQSEQAVAFGLIVTELLGNALRHAFPSGEAGTVRIGLRLQGSEIVASVADDGIGIQRDVQRNGTGLRIVALLALRLGGTLAFSGPPGSCCELRFEPQPLTRSAS